MSRSESLSLQELTNNLAKVVKYISPKNNSSWEDVKEILIQIASALHMETKQTIPPIVLEPICELRRIDIKVGGKEDIGELIPNSHGFLLIVEDMSKVRKRTTIAHEIGHSFFYDMEKSPPKKYFNGPIQVGKHGRSSEEWICYDFARSLLLPSSAMKRMNDTFMELPPTKVLKNITDGWGVSIDIFAKRAFHDLGLWRNWCIIKGIISKDGIISNSKVTSVFRGKQWSENRIFPLGKNGIISQSSEIQKYLQNFNESPRLVCDESEIKYNNESIIISATKFPFNRKLYLITIGIKN